MWGDVMNIWDWIDNLARGLKKVADESQHEDHFSNVVLMSQEEMDKIKKFTIG